MGSSLPSSWACRENAVPAGQRKDVLIRGGTVVSMDPGIGTLSRGDVLVRNGRIAEVGEVSGVRDVETIDASRMIVIPGLIETHFHMWSSLGRNFVAEGFEYFPAKWATAALYEPRSEERRV